ncbi:MAG: energy transducer TonB [Pseudomonadota bacterium]
MKKAMKGAFAALPAVVVTAFLGSVNANAAVALLEEPAILKAVPPSYPRAAERRSIEGVVKVSIDVAADGSVAAVNVVEANPAGIFDTSAINAVKRWKFEEGKPTQGVLKTIRFKLEG